MMLRTFEWNETPQCHRDPILLTPGPLTTSLVVKSAMMRDWGSRDHEFIALTGEMRARLLNVVNAADTHVAIPIPGSGTSIVEAAIATLVSRDEKLLVLSNGAYGDRIVEIAERLNLDVISLRGDEGKEIDVEQVASKLADDPGITYVAVVHCETTTGLLNPLSELAAVVKQFSRKLLVDAMSSFGALPIDLSTMPIAALVASSNKCLEGVPGVSFALIQKSVIAGVTHRCPSLSLDLVAQWKGFESNGQWRFTPPVQVVVALVIALRALDEEGGAPARLKRYQSNAELLGSGMTKLGFNQFLEQRVQSPIILTFSEPSSNWFSFESFYHELARCGYLIYPGKVTESATFRVGCIGSIDTSHITGFLDAVKVTVAKLRGDSVDSYSPGEC